MIAIVDTKGTFAMNVKMDIMMLAIIPATVCIFFHFHCFVYHLKIAARKLYTVK